MKDNIYNLTFKEMENYFINMGENPFKARIIYKYLYREKISSFEEIKELKASVIERLNKDFVIELPKLKDISEDESVIKLLISLCDDNLIESVLMRQKYGNSICVSTQVGCNMSCAFCQSGKFKKQRNLTAAEMVSEVMFMEKTLNQRISTIALMGIGEPLDNFDNVQRFIEIVSSDYGLGIGVRHITLSTCGLAPRIIELANSKKPVPLAISLHAPNDSLRDTIMPVNRAYRLNELREAMLYYTEKTKYKIFIEYIMIKDVNDSNTNAKELADYLQGINCTVNLIPYNETQSFDFKRSPRENILAFYDVLKKNNIHVTMRRELGTSVKAACGQLKSEYLS